MQLSRSELLQLMELSSKCLTATVPEQLEAIISAIYDLGGFRKAALCALSTGEEPIALTHYVNHSYGPKWAEQYTSENFQRIDPILIHASKNEGVFDWQQTSPPARKAGTRFLAAAQAFGLTDGISFSCAGGSPRLRSVLSLSGTPPDELGRIRNILILIGPHLHEAYRRVLEARPDGANVAAVIAPPADLSPREVEVLSWAQQGKTYWEIGSILGISPRTVKFHVAQVKAKLDVVSAAHAVAKAMRAGLLT